MEYRGKMDKQILNPEALSWVPSSYSDGKDKLLIRVHEGDDHPDPGTPPPPCSAPFYAPSPDPDRSLSNTFILGNDGVCASNAGHVPHSRGHTHQKASDSCLEGAICLSYIHHHKVVKAEVLKSC